METIENILNTIEGRLKYLKTADREWYDSRPEIVKAFIEKRPPFGIYRVKQTGQLCQILSIQEPEDGSECTCTVEIRSQIAPFLDRNVFGYKADDLELASTDEMKSHGRWDMTEEATNGNI